MDEERLEKYHICDVCVLEYKHKYIKLGITLLSGVALSSESLNRVLEGRRLSRQELSQAWQDSMADPAELLAASQNLRARFKGNQVTFSKKAFYNVVNLCKDECSYCTYKAEPGDAKLSIMSSKRLAQLLKLAKRYRCIEALFVTGEEPESRYSEAREWLKANGFGSTAEYLAHASESALESGLFPHTNAGNLKKQDMRELQKTNVSMGLMLESSSERLCERGMPHYMASSKRPKARLQTLRDAGSLKFPTTTGLLVGIGETPAEIIDSIIALRKLHEEFGHIQEVILQNFQPKHDTLMGRMQPADEDYFKRVVALTRIAMPRMNIQVPPNLSPHSYQSFLAAGINDWGGVSPLTPDYVNPEFSWPAIKAIRNRTMLEGFELKCRFPVYPEFFPLVSKELRSKMALIEDEGLVKESYWT